MPKRVFISYSTQDRGAAYRVCRQLEQQEGINCWIAPRDVRPGTDYAEEIIRAIEETPAMVVLLSDGANASPFVRSEVERAFSKGRTVIPFRTQDVAPSGALEFFLSSTHWIDAWNPPLEGKVKVLAMAIGAVTSSPPPPPSAPPPPPTDRQRQLEAALKARLDTGKDKEALAIARALFKLDPYHDLVREVLDGTIGEMVRLQGGGSPITVAISPDGRYAVSGTQDIRLWDLAAGLEIKRLQTGAGLARKVGFSPDGDLVYCGHSDNTIRTFEVASGQEVSSFPCEGSRAFAFSDDGLRVISSGDSMVYVWDLGTGDRVALLEGHTAPVEAVVFSRDRVYSAGEDKTIREWDLELGIEMQCLVGARYSILSLAISPDGRHLVSAGYGDVRMWDMEAGDTCRMLADHGSEMGMLGPTHHRVRALAYAPDGHSILSGGEDGLVRVQAVRGSGVHLLKGHAGNVWSVAPAPDGRRALSGGQDGIILWGLPQQ